MWALSLKGLLSSGWSALCGCKSIDATVFADAVAAADSFHLEFLMPEQPPESATVPGIVSFEHVTAAVHKGTHALLMPQQAGVHHCREEDFVQDIKLIYRTVQGALRVTYTNMQLREARFPSIKCRSPMCSAAT